MNTTAILIDTFKRELNVSTVSVTRVEGRGIVIRYGGEVGTLNQLVEGGTFYNDDFPIIVLTGGYHARSRAGFVSVVVSSYGGADQRGTRENVVGMLGMPFQKGKGLMVLSEPLEALVLPAGTHIRAVSTHGNSNPASADAADAAVRMRADINRSSVFVMEGQSDYVQAFELFRPRFAEDRAIPVFPEEHQTDRFDDASLVRAALRKIARGETRDAREGQVFLNATRMVAGEKDLADHCLTRFVKRVVGNRLNDGIFDAYNVMKEEGWRVKPFIDGFNEMAIKAVSPDGEVVASFSGIYQNPESLERILEISLELLTHEEDRAIEAYISQRREFISANN